MTLRLLFIGAFAIVSLGIVAIVLALRWLMQRATGDAVDRRKLARGASAHMPGHKMPDHITRRDAVQLMRRSGQQRGRRLRVAVHAGPRADVRVVRDPHAGVLARADVSGKPAKAMF